MNTRADKMRENRSEPSPNRLAKPQSNVEAMYHIVDNRQEGIFQRKIQEGINDSHQVRQSRVYQEMADNAPQVKHLACYQAMANSFTSEAAQLKAKSVDETLQRKPEPFQKKENKTGLPDHLKLGIENLSGFSMDDVNVYYNSDRPAELQAHAYAQGTDIHLGSGQEKHLPHEAWHVVQQKQRRVKPTIQMKGKVKVNDDAGLENEANMMGTKAFEFVDQDPGYLLQKQTQPRVNELSYAPIQLMKKWTLEGGYQDIGEAPADLKDWYRCKYKGEETFLKNEDMENFVDWRNVDTYDDEPDIDTHDDKEKVGEMKVPNKKEEIADKFPGLKEGDVTSITIIKESKSDHQYVIAMVKGGGNIKMHYGDSGGLYQRSDEIDNEHGIPVASYGVPQGLTGDDVTRIFETTKDQIACKFEGGNCGRLANELVEKLGGISEENELF